MKVNGEKHNIKTQKGSIIKRSSKYGVGKFIGGSIYVHKTYENVLPKDELELAKKQIDNYDYQIVKYNEKTKNFTFIKSSDFDDIEEPTIEEYLIVYPDGKTKNKTVGSQIYHHKWLFVKDDYSNFDIEESKERSKLWLSLPDINFSKIGNKQYWSKNIVPLLQENKKTILRKKISLLLERILDINDDVDMIYDKFYKKGYETIKKTGIFEPNLFNTSEFNSSELTSKLSREANEKNPITIFINHQSQNIYNPLLNYIKINYPMQLARLTLNYNGDIRETSKHISSKQVNHFLKEFKIETIKGSIHHELSHWIDDTLHNSHIKKKILTRKFSTKNVNAQPFEINAQIHNIIQLKREFEDDWDNLSVKDLISLSPTLFASLNSLSEDSKKPWLLKLLHRMSRENLLGKKMKY